ncbi:MAG: hypothetical protein ACRBBW_06885 [Cellvibrionaceae bacterium]
MQKIKFEIILATSFALIFLAACAFWGDWFGGKMSQSEVDDYLVKIEKNLQWPEPMKSYMMDSLREWGYADDGKEFMMLNMMRYHNEVNRFPNSIEGFSGSPKDANDTYEILTKEIVLSQGGWPNAWGEVNLSRNVARANSNANNTQWNRVGFARYPNRRGFFKLMSTPEYGKVSPYKLMGAHTNLIPMTPQWVIPDLRLMTGMILIIVFLLIGWIRSVRR